jgi:hypothetical protein
MYSSASESSSNYSGTSSKFEAYTKNTWIWFRSNSQLSAQKFDTHNWTLHSCSCIIYNHATMDTLLYSISMLHHIYTRQY